MDRCKCGSFAINEHAHGRIKGKHSDLCDVCYWREEAKQARQEAARECIKMVKRQAPPLIAHSITAAIMTEFGLEG